MFLLEPNFFDEGGHSILAKRMFFHSKREWKDIDLPVSVIFQSQTFETLTAEVDRTQALLDCALMLCLSPEIWCINFPSPFARQQHSGTAQALLPLCDGRLF